MRDILISIMIILSILVTSVFFVGTNFVSLEVNALTNNINVYKTGVHFRIPLITNLIYINLLERNDSININIIENNVKVQNEYMLLWHVTDGSLYYKNFLPKKQQLFFEYIKLYQEHKNVFNFFKNNGIVVDKTILVNKNILN
jgi:hypothetical protein